MRNGLTGRSFPQSHAQKYFSRQQPGKEKKKRSIHDTLFPELDGAVRALLFYFRIFLLSLCLLSPPPPPPPFPVAFGLALRSALNTAVSPCGLAFFFPFSFEVGLFGSRLRFPFWALACPNPAVRIS